MNTVMNTATIREKLYDYIRVADEKKVKAIYTMLEDEITEEVAWWKDNAFTAELDKRYAAWEDGSEVAYTMSDIELSIEQLRKKRSKK